MVLGVSVGAAHTAVAQDASQKAMAEALFQQGLDLFDKGRTHEACARFEESQRIDPKLSTLINLATCHERDGLTASAWEEFTEAAAQADKSKLPDRAKTSRDEAKALGAKLSTVKLSRAADVPGMTLALDKKSIDTGMIGAPLPLDPGTHHIDVGAPGYVTWSHDFEVQQGPIEVPVEIPELRKDTTAPQAPTSPQQPAPPVAPTASPSPPATPPPQQPQPRAHGVSPVAITSFAIGGAALVGAIATGAASLSLTGSLKDACGTKSPCVATDDGKYKTAYSLAYASDSLYPIAGVGAVVGVAVLIATMGSSDEKRTATIIQVGDVGAGIRLRF